LRARDEGPPDVGPELKILVDEEGQMKMHIFGRCRSKTNPRTAFWCMSILALIVSFPVAGLCQDPADNGPSNVAYWNGGTGTWFGSGGSSNWVCEVRGSEYNCKPPSSAAWTAIVGAAGPNLDGSASLTLKKPVTVGLLLIGDGTNGNVTVTGSNKGKPTLIATSIVVGVTHSGSTVAPDTLTISGGAIVNDTSAYIGDHGKIGKVSNGVVTVTGTGSQWNNSGLLEVGVNGNGTLNISGGGSVTALLGIVGTNGPSTGTVSVSDAGSTFTGTQFLDIGLGGTGILNVSGGATAAAGTTATPGQFLIGTTGTVNVTGTGGNLVGNITNSGTLDPITVTNITGNYTQVAGGTTILDVSGPGSYGQLNVSGNVDLNGTLTIDFLNGKPTGKTDYNLITTTGTFNDSNLMVDLIGCPGCKMTETFMNGQFTTTVSPAEPETLFLLAISLIAMVVFVGRMRHSILLDLGI